MRAAASEATSMTRMRAAASSCLVAAGSLKRCMRLCIALERHALQGMALDGASLALVCINNARPFGGGEAVVHDERR
ncbi:hypothetical protein PC122_g4359 [Phytophthora cactorum]|nr:hypothetical protein PC122_g4359 [Phytophthora cactorum]